MKYTHLQRGERCRIFEARCQKKSYGRIAKEIGRDKSAVWREVKRNSDKIGYLYPHQADELTQKRRHNRCVKKINQDSSLKAFVIKHLKNRLSPKMIAAQWCKENPGKKISKSPIYDFVYSQEGHEMGLYKLLVRAKKKRGIIQKSKKPMIKNRVSIHERPQEINGRNSPGDFEGDLIFNKGSMSQNVLTLIDRVTREAVMIHNKSKHTDVVLGRLTEYIKAEKITINSITFDNGSEFAGHEQLNKLGIKTYFCDPGKPYQKGSIENLNGVVRRYLPFNLPANQITPALVQDAMIKVNNLPRESLGWLSAREYAQQLYFQQAKSLRRVG